MTTQFPKKINQPFGFRNPFQDLSLRFPPSSLRSTGPGQVDAMRKESSPTAFIFSPSENQRINAGDVAVKGYAFTDICSEIERVELSLDGGKTWVSADLAPNPQPGEWRLWRKHIRLTPGQYELVVSAIDNLSKTGMPDLDLACHRVCFEVIA